MSSHFCITLRFLDAEPRFHGRRGGGVPEWPPSPLRLFQAMLATASRRMPGPLPEDVQLAFAWFEGLPPPLVIAPTAIPAVGYRLSVPNNALDVVAAAWSRGNYATSGDSDPRTHRAMKMVRPMLLQGGASIHYVWDVVNADAEPARLLSEIARSLVALGWGVDLVTGDGTILSTEQVESLAGERWSAGGEGIDGLRLPMIGTFADLGRRHKGFLNRLEGEAFVPPPNLTAFRTLGYRRAVDAPHRAVAAFAMLKPDASGFRAFDSMRRGLTVAGMLRHAMKNAAIGAGWASSTVAQLVLGHTGTIERGGAAVGGPRLMYLPLPSIEARGDGRIRVGTVRRCIVSASGESGETDMAKVRRCLAGADLVDERLGETVALLSLVPGSDAMARNYTDEKSTWATVTPVVLPGYDDPDHIRRKLGSNTLTSGEQARLVNKLAARIDSLLRKALVQAGFSETIAKHVELDWRSVGFLPGVDQASRYGVPSHLKRFPRVHVKLRFRTPNGDVLNVAGPVCIGGGRFNGTGLFVGVNEP